MRIRKSQPCCVCGEPCRSLAPRPRCLSCHLQIQVDKREYAQDAPDPAETLAGTQRSDEAIVDALWLVWGNKTHLPAINLARVCYERPRGY